MGNDVSSEITKEDLIEIQKRQIKLEEQNKKIQEDLLRQKKINKLQKKNIPSKPNRKIPLRVHNSNINIDPFKILGIDPDTSIEDIKVIYKQLLLKYHPDKSGYDSNEEYKLIQKAYSLILQMKKDENEITNKLNQTIETKKDERVELDNNLNRQNYYFEPSTGRNFNNSKFNQMFDQHKFNDENDVGYSDWLKNDSNFKQEQPSISSSSKLNSVFDEYIQKVSNSKQVIQYIDPETGISTSAEYDYLVNENNDFTKHGKYTDLKKAYTENNIIHPGKVASRDNFTTIEQVKSSRSAPIILSKEEQMFLEKKKNEELEREYERVQKLKDRDTNIEKYYTQIHGRAIELPSYRK